MHFDGKRNLGTIDRVLRLVGGLILLALGIAVPTAMSTAWLGIVWIGGLALSIEGAFGY